MQPRGKDCTHEFCIKFFNVIQSTDSSARTSSDTRRTTTPHTSSGQHSAPHYTKLSFSTAYDDGADLAEDDLDDEDVEASIERSAGKDNMRRSRRVAKKKLLNGEDEEEDSGEEYNPRNRTKRSAKMKKGVATRNRGRVTVQYNEESEEEETAVTRTTNVVKVTKKVHSDVSESSSSSGEEGAGPSKNWTNGQLCGTRTRLGSTSSSEDEEAEKTKKSNGVNGVARRVRGGLVGKRKGKEIANVSEDSEDSSDSASDSEPQPVTKKANNKRKKPSSSDGSSSNSSRPRRKKQQQQQKSAAERHSSRILHAKNNKSQVMLNRQAKDESEVEFDEEDLESSSEESLEEVAVSKKLRNSRRPNRGVASGVRRARRVIDCDPDEDEADLLTDQDFIDDADVTEEEETSDESSSSDEDGRGRSAINNKKKKSKPPAKPKSTKQKKQSKKKAKSSKTKSTPTKKKPPKKSTPGTSQPTPKKRTPPGKRHLVQELISVNRPGQDPIPYQPINMTSQQVMINDVKHRGRVVGQMITSRYHNDDEESQSEASTTSSTSSSSSSGESEDENQDKAVLSRHKRLHNADRKGKIHRQKRPRVSEDEEDEVSVSSRGRVRKASIMMKDFI